jgi:hypothetical protein
VVLPVVVLALLAAVWKEWLPLRAWWLVVGLQLLMVGSGLAALKTGEQDEERVEELVSERVIHSHEEAAERFMVAAGGVLGIAVATLLARRNRAWVRAGSVATLVGSLGVVWLAIDTGRAGGKLVYDHGAANAYVQERGGPERVGGAASGGEHEEEDDH